MPKFLPLLLILVGLSLFMEGTSSSSVIIDEMMDEDVATMAIGDSAKYEEEEEDDSSVSEWNSSNNKFKRATTDSEEGHSNVAEGRKKGGKKCGGKKKGHHGSCPGGHTCVRTCRSKCVRTSSALDVPASCLVLAGKKNVTERCEMDETTKLFKNDTCCTGNCLIDSDNQNLAYCCLGPLKPGMDCSLDHPEECCDGQCKQIGVGEFVTKPTCCMGRGGKDVNEPCATNSDCCFMSCDPDTHKCS